MAERENPEKAQGGRIAPLDLAIIAALLLLAVLLRAYHLGFPPKLYFDEIYYARAADAYIEGKEDPNWVHPPLGKILIAGGILLNRSFTDAMAALGYGPPIKSAADWRTACMIFGSLMIPLIYLLALRLFRNRYAASLSAFLLTIEFLHFVESRISMIDIFLGFFMLCGSYFAWRFIESSAPSSKYLFLSAACFGLSAACKWSGVFGAFGAYLCMVLLKDTHREKEAFAALEAKAADEGSEKKRGPWKDLLARGLVKLPRALTIAAVFFLFGLTMQVLSFVPFFLTGGTLSKALGYYSQTLNFHYHQKWEHPYLSKMWMWPLMIRPIWYLFDEVKGTVYGIVAMGSPLFWWGFLIFFVELVILTWYERRKEQFFLIVSYLTPYIFWIISNKGGFFYYMTPCAAWMCLIVAGGMDRWRETKAGRVMGWLFLATLVFFFVLFYSILAGFPIPRALFNKLMWTRSWI
ncbi:MAG: phospholipid carrier-dependent glycosyltransferase [Candidatus Eremiobacteraeota bacterium]|nr:phospholipid carrier-dependent glycosyltransferase [Candidatus Eremiobacteraeota bacterium]